ncbi:MAG: 2-C-methyl-D-erythritol 4-phosphate cytidylyltransferase [Candidatus Margulisbacteria bacterium]|nr:2-C-methyl-D-erythritol 4-phosphate cytidylyltransferase [Candidatus Margulisiibacteriota bacterium]
MKTVAIITAAGFGKRMGQPKQFIELAGKSILERTLSVFDNCKLIDSIILVVNQEDVERAKKFKFEKLEQVVAGGKERQDSVSNGLKVLAKEVEIVVIHDGARPFVTLEIIENSVRETEKAGAVVVGVPVKDTIKEVGELSGSRVAGTLDRQKLWAAQTPQVFKKDIILQAYSDGATRCQVTDDAMLVEKLGVPVKMVMGSYRNIKITTPEDLLIARAFLKEGEQNG